MVTEVCESDHRIFAQRSVSYTQSFALVQGVSLLRAASLKRQANVSNSALDIYFK